MDKTQQPGDPVIKTQTAAPRLPALFSLALIKLAGHEQDGGPAKLLADEIATEACWHGLTRAGNKAQAEGRAVEAWDHYQAALIEAERLFESALDGGSPFLAPMVHTISCLNFAEAKARCGDYTAACDFGMRALGRLVTTAESPPAPLPLRVNCVRHMPHAIAPLQQWRKVRLEAGDALQYEAIRGLIARSVVVAKALGQIIPLVLPKMGMVSKHNRSGVAGWNG